MKQDARIASRNAMCVHFEASRSTVDAVIADLMAEGKVYTVKGSGTFVSPKLPESYKVDSGGNIVTWAVLVPDVRYYVYPEMCKGISDFTRENGIALMICNTDDDPKREYSYLQKLVMAGVNGIIIVPALTDAKNVIGYQYLKERRIPFIFWNRSYDYMSDVPQVCINGYHGGRIAVEHLLEKGYRRIAYIAPIRFRSSMDRFFGYSSALEIAGIELDINITALELPKGRAEEAKDCARAMLLSNDPPDAFLCFTDELAIFVEQAVRGLGLRVSDDVGLIGFESSSTPADDAMQKKLTYISINSYQSGRHAGYVLKELMNRQPEVKHRLSVFNPRLVLRESCLGPLKQRRHTCDG